MIPTLLAAFEKPTTKDFVWSPWGPTIHLFGVPLFFNFILFLVTIAFSLFVITFFLAFRKPKVVPGKFQALMEMGLEFVKKEIVDQMLGPEGGPFFALFATYFFIIMFGNILEVVPGINFSPNSRIMFPLILALVSWVTYNTVGIQRHGFGGYMKIVLFPPGAPKVLYIILTPIQFLSEIIIRPITLSVRLFANMLAGHFLLAVFFLGTIALLHDGFLAIVGVFAGAMSVVLVAFEIFVSLLQAFIFSVLSASYIAGAMASEH